MPGGSGGSRRLRAVPAPGPTDPHPIESTPDYMLDCRSDGHPFPYGDPKLDRWRPERDPRTGRVVELSRTMMCPRCHTIVRDVIVRGELGARQRQYTYPTGYSMPKGFGVTRREARAELTGRLFARYDAEPDDVPHGRPASDVG